MEQHWKLRDLGLTIVFSVIYFAVVLAATIMGGIHPLLYLFVTALIALVAWIPYMYVMAKVPKAGVVLIMNLFVAIAFVAFGELANLLLGSLIVCSILAEIIRKWAGYKNYKGIVMSYILDFSVVYGSCYCRNRSYLNNCRSYCKKGLQQAVCKCWDYVSG